MKWQLVWGKSRYMLPLIKVVNDKNVMGVIAPIEDLWIPPILNIEIHFGDMSITCRKHL